MINRRRRNNAEADEIANAIHHMMMLYSLLQHRAMIPPR